MPDRDEAFFDELGRLGYVAALGETRGSVRFDIGDGHQVAHWLVSIDLGDIVVSSDDREADCVIRLDTASFRRLVEGETVPFAAFLSNEIGIDGSFGLLILLRHLFPGPPGARDPRELAKQNGYRQ